MAKHECITTEQMQKWEKERNMAALDKATMKSNSCALCRRIWMRFWASKKSPSQTT